MNAVLSMRKKCYRDIYFIIYRKIKYIDDGFLSDRDFL